jgi:hypothetical protein
MAQFPLDVLDVDCPRPRRVRCVSCVTTVVLATGAFDTDDVGADEEALTADGAASESEYTLARRSAEVAGLAGGRTEEADLVVGAGAGAGEGEG